MENLTKYIYIACAIISLIGVAYLVVVLLQLYHKQRKPERFSFSTNYFLGLLLLLPFLSVLYVAPLSQFGDDFWVGNVQEHEPLKQAIYFLGTTIIVFYLLVAAVGFLPHKNKYHNIVPSLLLLSLFPGGANASMVMIITD